MLVVRTSWCIHKLIIVSVAEEGFLLSLGCSSPPPSVHLLRFFSPPYHDWLVGFGRRLCDSHTRSVILFFTISGSLFSNILFYYLYLVLSFALFFAYFNTVSSSLSSDIRSWEPHSLLGRYWGHLRTVPKKAFKLHVSIQSVF